MNKNALADKLLASRHLPPAGTNGDGPIAHNGSKLSEAASYLKAARTCDAALRQKAVWPAARWKGME